MDTHQLKLRMLAGMRDDLRMARMCRATRAGLTPTHHAYEWEKRNITARIQDFRDNARNRRQYYRRQYLKYGQGALS